MRKSEGTVGQLLSLRDINIEIKHGEFVCIIGDVGSGKSSLLSAMIGDMLYLESNFLQKHSSRNLEDLVSSKIMKERVKEHANKDLKPSEAPI